MTELALATIGAPDRTLADNSRRPVSFLRNTAKLVGAIGILILSPSAASGTSISDLALVYEANFDDGTLNPSVDAFGVGPMQFGDTLIPGSNPSEVVENGGVTLSITRPANAPAGPVDAGVGLTPVSFGLGSIVGIRAVYALPLGPHDASDTWAVGLVARTGSVSDLPAALRAAATFQVVGNTARLNTPFATTPAIGTFIQQSVYDAIFSPPDPDPTTFTLELLIDRTTGLADASLTSGAYTIARENFMFSTFSSTSGPPITSLGSTVAINSGPDTSASVRVLDFQVFEQVPEPETLSLFGVGLAGAVAMRRRRTKI
jgi:hypothetical protein